MNRALPRRPPELGTTGLPGLLERSSTQAIEVPAHFLVAIKKGTGEANLATLPDVSISTRNQHESTHEICSAFHHRVFNVCCALHSQGTSPSDQTQPRVCTRPEPRSPGARCAGPMLVSHFVKVKPREALCAEGGWGLGTPLSTGLGAADWGTPSLEKEPGSLTLGCPLGLETETPTHWATWTLPSSASATTLGFVPFPRQV